MKIDFTPIALTIPTIIFFLSIICVFSSYEVANAQGNIVLELNELNNITSDDTRVVLGKPLPTTNSVSSLNAEGIAQTNTLKLDSDVKNLVILIPDKRLITQNFLPLDATIVEGTKVIWINGDKVGPHHITLENSEMQPIFNEAIPYQNGTEYTFDTPGTYTVSDPLNTYTSLPSGRINVIASRNAPDNLSTNSSQVTAGLFVVPAEDKERSDNHFNMLGYHVEDSYMIPGPEGNDVQLYVYTQKSGMYPTILNRTAMNLQFLPFSDLVHQPIIMQNFKGIKADIFTEGLSHPTSMGFVDNTTILVLEKDTGNVRKISDGVLQNEPVLRVDVNNSGELGLLGVAVLKKEKQEGKDINIKLNLKRIPSKTSTDFISNSTSNVMSPSLIPSQCNCSVFIYFTLKNENTTVTNEDGGNINNGSPRNVIYKYDWDGKSLFNPKLLVDLPAPAYHNSGKLKISPASQLYAVIGDPAGPNSILRNHSLNDSDYNNNESLTNNSSVLICINPGNSFPSRDNSFMKSYVNNSDTQMVGKEGREGMNYYNYYAYGIRNSFGLAFDPVTGKLWDTENGEDEYDEINIVSPGFNSGWPKIMGPISRSNNTSNSNFDFFKDMHYSDPIFGWKKAVGVTDIEFFSSSKLGDEYTNNLFVGDINNGNLYFFKVNDDRSGLNFEDIPGIANDLIADNTEETNAVTVGTGFGGITDIETGPDGFLYILTYHDGRIYKITND